MGATNGFDAFQVTLAASGTQQVVEPDPSLDVPGSENPQIGGLVIRAMAGNTGKIYLGGTNRATLATTGYELSPGEAVALDKLGANNVWFDGSHTGDKI